jgi:RNA polymerase sigma-70 factor (ECF subfamily)
MSDTPNETDLIASAVAGDRLALQQLLLSRCDDITRYVAPKLPAALQAATGVEDILQQTFIQAFRDIRTFDPHGGRSPDAPAALSAWLRTIAEHRLQDAIRAARRKKRGGDLHRIERDLARHDASAVDLFDMLADGASTPSRSVARHEAVRAVSVAMAGLPEHYCEAVRLRYLEGQSVEQIGQAMQRSPGAVRGLLQRAKDALREALGESSRYLSKK